MVLAAALGGAVLVVAGDPEAAEGQDEVVGGSLTNNGTLESSGSGGRWMPINLANSATGTVNVLRDTGSNGTWSSAGALAVTSGQTFTGKVRETWLGGQRVYGADGHHAEPTGRPLLRRGESA